MNKLRAYLNVEPTTLTIVPTHKCTASCHDCCFSCSPKIDYMMDMNKIVGYIDQAFYYYPMLKVVVFTGGECFLLGDKLVEAVKHAASYGVVVRVVTNGYWASSYEKARKIISKLVKVGLKEINFSTGDNHQKYVPYKNIVNGVLASHDAGLKAIGIAVESPVNAVFTSKTILEDEKIVPLIQSKKVFYINSAWMNFKKDNEVIRNKKIGTIQINSLNEKPCSYIFRGISINPYSQMLACCGLTVEYNKYLKLGSLDLFSIKELYEAQFNDFFKIWLYIAGPEHIYRKFCLKSGSEFKYFPHECAYCIELVKDKNNIPIIKELIEENMSDILFHYEMNNRKYKVVNCGNL